MHEVAHQQSHVVELRHGCRVLCAVFLERGGVDVQELWSSAPDPQLRLAIRRRLYTCSVRACTLHRCNVLASELLGTNTATSTAEPGAPPSCRSALQFRCCGSFGRWIRR